MKSTLRKLTTHPLMAGSVIVFAGSMLSNVGSYLYHLLTGRILGPVGYGELASLISLLYIFGVPANVLTTVMVKYFSQCKAQNDPGMAKDLIIRVSRVLSGILGAFFVVFLFLTPLIGSFLHLTTNRSLVWVNVGFILSIYGTLVASVFQGFQMFVWTALFGAAGIFTKLALSTPLSRFGVEWAMVGSMLSTFIVLALFLLPIRFILSSHRKPFALTKRSMLEYSIPAFFSLLGMTALYSLDVVLVRHFFPAQQSGLYSAMATLGKVIFYASSAITTVLFPVLSERHAKKESGTRMLWLAIGAVGCISSFVTAVYFLYPRTVIHLLFGPSYDAGSAFLGMFAVFISMYSVANVLVFACLATNRMRIGVISMGVALLQIVGIVLFHGALTDILLVNSVAVSLLIILSAGYLMKSTKASTV